MNGPMLDGCTPWPDDMATYYRAMGYWRGQSLGAMLRASATAYPDRVALVCGERRWNYQQFDERCDQFAAGLARIGVKQQDRVVVQLPNVAEFFVACFALFRLGALPVLALPAHRRSEVAYFCQLAEARAYITADFDAGFDYRVLAREVQAEAPSLEQVIVVGEAAEFTPFDALCDAPRTFPCPDAGAVAFLQLSGGSTGLPKMIPRTHDDYLYSVRASAAICELDQHSVYLCALPVAHNFPLSSPGTLGVFYAGGCVVLARRADPDHAFALIAAEQVTLTALVPPLAMAWLDAASGSAHDLASLQLLQVGGARLPRETALRVGPVLGCALQQVFGMAEGLVNYTRSDDAPELVATTQGRPISPDDEVRIVDDEDRPLPPGATGHLQTRGPYTIRGYYRAAAHNARAFTADGFYRTGDLVMRLPSGHLVVEGRAKDQINRGGDKVAAEEVENHLLAHGAVHDAALVAMPDAFLGERSCAFIIARGPAPRARELTDFLRARGLAQFKIPDRIEFVAAFPKTGVGKVDKRLLREQIAQRLNIHPTP
jgi:2,3-dihydroxybenzoate-AMP ligase